jgi:hypothetical protein
MTRSTVESGVRLKAVSSYASQPSTPETDAMTRIMHTVRLSDGSERQVISTDPLTAIDQVDILLGNGENI